MLIQESARGYTHITLEDELFKSRKIFLTDEINTESAISVIKQLMVLDEAEDKSPIKLYLSTPGGSINAGLAILDCINNSIKSQVDTICIGLVASMGAVLFSGGNHRSIYPSAKLLIHDPLITETGGPALKLKAVSDNLLDYRNITGKILADNCGKTLEEVLALTATDTYFTASEAVDFGLADCIIGGTKI